MTKRNCIISLFLFLIAIQVTDAKMANKSLIEQTSFYYKGDIQSTDPMEIVAFARRLLGVLYKYGGSNPKLGFDCSGFVNYVFKNFHFPVPRSSSAFSKRGQKVSLEEACPGDLILFRGTNPRVRSIGHIGIIISNIGEPLKFIHASSGKSQCVTETSLDARYQKRFVKVIRIL